MIIIDIRQLSYFLEVANQVSFSKASQTLHVSQPTLSKMVKNMEDELGVVLLNRSTRRIQLTDVGEVVQIHAQYILKAMENLNTALENVTHMKKGKFILGLPPVIGASFFPRIITQFQTQHPFIDFQVVEEGGKQIEQSLIDGRIDLGIVVLPVDEEEFEVVPLIKRELKLIVNPDHPLAKRNEVSLNELSEESFILFRKGFALYDRIREACISEGFEPRVAYESTQWDFISEMVAAKHGISFLPDMVCKKLDPAQIAVISTIKPKIKWNIAIIWRKNNYLSYAAKGWVQFVRDFFDDGIGKA